MSKPEILEKTPISMAELKSELNSITKKEKEPGFRTGKTIEYLNSFHISSKASFAELKKKIEDLNVPRLKEEHIVKILDILPNNVNELGVVLQAYNVTISKENQSAIIGVLKEKES